MNAKSSAVAPPPAPDPETDSDEGPSEVDLLIEATWMVAAQSGNIEPSVRDILQYAGLSTKAFYRHFKSKDELLLVALDRGAAVLVEYLEHRMAERPEPLSRIAAWIEGCMRQTVNPSAARRSLPWTLGFGRIATAFPEEFDRNQASIMAPLQREIEGAVADGTGCSPDPARDARLIFGYTMYTVRTHFINSSVPSAEAMFHLVDFAHRSLGAGSPR